MVKKKGSLGGEEVSLFSMPVGPPGPIKRNNPEEKSLFTAPTG